MIKLKFNTLFFAAVFFKLLPADATPHPPISGVSHNRISAVPHHPASGVTGQASTGFSGVRTFSGIKALALRRVP